MRKDYYLLLLCLVIVFLTGCGADQALKKAEKYYAVGEYFDAAAKYRKAYTSTPAKEKDKRGEISAKMAECYRRINSTNKAITA